MLQSSNMHDKYFDKIMSIIIIVFLVVLSFLIVRPILNSIIFALILGFIFTPFYLWLYKKTKSRNLSASLIIVLLLIVIILPLWFLTPVLLKQSFSIYQATQATDFITPFKSAFPALFSSDQFSAEIGSIFSSFISRTANSLVNSISNIIINIPTLSLQFLVVLFTFFFILTDGDVVLDYVKSVLPFPKEIEKKIFQYAEDITASVLYGQVVIGFIQGVIASIGFFIFGAPNPLFLTLLAVVAGILPLIGPLVISVPVAIYLFVAGNNFAGWGILAFGLISSLVDHFLRPIIVARRTKMHMGLVLISTIGGLFFFGIIGLILGPLITAYLIILLEVYRGKPTGVLVEEAKK